MRNEKTTRKGKMVNLKSVGCVLTDNGLVIPIQENGELDYGLMTHILDIDNDEDFFHRLDKKDRKIVDTFVKEQTDFWGSQEDEG